MHPAFSCQVNSCNATTRRHNHNKLINYDTPLQANRIAPVERSINTLDLLDRNPQDDVPLPLPLYILSLHMPHPYKPNPMRPTSPLQLLQPQHQIPQKTSMQRQLLRLLQPKNLEHPSGTKAR